jgi:hypothetical protein
VTRPRLRLVVVAALLLSALPGHAAPAPSRASGWVLTRTGRGPARLSVRLHRTSTRAEGSILAFAVARTARGHELASRFGPMVWTFGEDGWARPYGPGVTYPGCPEPACTDPAPRTPVTPERVTVTAGSLDATAYVAAWDTTVELEDVSPGWRARPWRPSMRVRTTADGGGVGVRALHVSTGTFREATSAGGRFGSIAYGHLPCGSNGAGQGTFTGGRRRYGLYCGGFNDASMEWTPAPARWRLAGEVTSVLSDDVVLIVVDFPA